MRARALGQASLTPLAVSLIFILDAKQKRRCPCSHQGKRGTLQIVFGLLCTAVACPIAVEVFGGSTGDPKTVAAQVDKIRNRFGLQRVVLVGDCGMLTGTRIREDPDLPSGTSG